MIKEFLEQNPNPIQPGYVFALLPEKTKDVYHRYIKKAADSLDLICESSLDFKHPSDSLRDILASIQKAEILIYDITGLTPNVMWELGLALAIKDANRVIVIREESYSSLPFNIYSHRVSFQYDPNSEESLTELQNMLREVMKQITRTSSRKPHLHSPEVRSLLEGALKAVERKEWIVAETLFQIMDDREPNNWFIRNQWGIMQRSKGELEAASEKLNEALTLTDSDDDKAFIYTELAVLHQKSREYGEAEEAFRTAEKADSENRHLYISWAEYHDELGDYFNAQAKISGALGRLKYKDDNPEYKELMLRHEYYGKKIQGYGKTFDQFKREAEHPARRAPAHREDHSDRLPYNISWDALIDNHVGSIVEGEISNITERGIFVRLSREFTGLIFWKNLMEDFGERFAKNQKVKVRLSKAFIDARDQKGRIDLRLIDEQGGIIRPQPVLLGASAPREVRPGELFTVRFAAYLKKFEKAVKNKLKQLSPDSETYLAVREARWQLGTRVTIQLSSPNLLISSPEEEFTWQGSKEIIDFRVQAPSDIQIKRTLLYFNVLIGGISVANFVLDLGINSSASQGAPMQVLKTPASTGFASYASKDRQRVLDRTSEICRSGFDLWMDCLDLRPGETWKAELEKQIKNRDLFLLFWAASAKKSKWVRWEWKTALRERGISGIEPHPLDPVSEAEPPKELNKLHFGDPYMLLRKAYRETQE